MALPEPESEYRTELLLIGGRDSDGDGGGSGFASSYTSEIPSNDDDDDEKPLRMKLHYVPRFCARIVVVGDQG